MKKIVSIITILMGISFAQVSLEIKNVDRDAGTLDIYMTNEAGCSYCSNPIYGTFESCVYIGGHEWLFTAGMSDVDCQEQIGQYFDGRVGGFSFP